MDKAYSTPPYEAFESIRKPVLAVHRKVKMFQNEIKNEWSTFIVK